ncbi:hypothetical protein EON67_10195 [archaeon]|nr:MAG: hypothetical protein EON67_10195 [archaeon]
MVLPHPFSSYAVMFDDAKGMWRETQSLTTRDGLVTSQTLLLRPIADGICSVELAEEHGVGVGSGSARHGGVHTASPSARTASGGAPRSGMAGASSGTSSPRPAPHTSAATGVHPRAGRDFTMKLQEHSDDLLIVTAHSVFTGKPILVETITLLSDMARVRTVQRYDDMGVFQAMYMIREERVIDAVTGAVMEPPRRRHTGTRV